MDADEIAFRDYSRRVYELVDTSTGHEVVHSRYMIENVDYRCSLYKQADSLTG